MAVVPVNLAERLQGYPVAQHIMFALMLPMPWVPAMVLISVLLPR